MYENEAKVEGDVNFGLTGNTETIIDESDMIPA
jgi:hypothetical protein